MGSKHGPFPWLTILVGLIVVLTILGLGTIFGLLVSLLV